MYWNVQRQPSGIFEIWTDGGPRIVARNESELKRQLAGNSVSDKWYEQVLAQLANGDGARVEVPTPGKFSQVATPR